MLRKDVRYFNFKKVDKYLVVFLALVVYDLCGTYFGFLKGFLNSFHTIKKEPGKVLSTASIDNNILGNFH